jgi:hypothetical protein
VSNIFQQFFVLQKRYPQGLDSLLTIASGTPAVSVVYGSTATSEATQVNGLPFKGADSTSVASQLTVATLTNVTGTGEYARSLSRVGIDWVYDHDITLVNSNLSNTTQRNLVDNANGTSGTTAVAVPRVAEVTLGSNLQTKLCPSGLKSGQRIIAFGFGQRNSAIGKTSGNAPLFPGTPNNIYGRYIVYLMIYASGERATLLGVSDAFGRTPDFTGQQFNESLPEGSRQG